MNKLLNVILILNILSVGNVFGQSYTPLSLPHIFSNHMVLQRGDKTSIWGGGQLGRTICLIGSWNPKDAVKVRINGNGK